MFTDRTEPPKTGDSKTHGLWHRNGTMNTPIDTGATKTWILTPEGTFCYPLCLSLRRTYGFLRSSWKKTSVSTHLLSSGPLPPQHFTRQGLWKFCQLSKVVGYQKCLAMLSGNLCKDVSCRAVFSGRSFFSHHLWGLAFTKICRW